MNVKKQLILMVVLFASGIQVSFASERSTDEGVAKTSKYVCEICNRTLSGATSLKAHILTHTGEKPFKCDFPGCDKAYAAKRACDDHYRSHTGDMPFKCGICGKGFMRKQLCTLHEERHSDERAWECTYPGCWQRFKTKPDLVRHEQRHIGDRPFACEQCGDSFGDIGGLRRHERIHTGVKKHVCGTCGMAFAESSTLKRHEITHTGEKNYRCETCGGRFADAGGLRKHEILHTGEKPHKCSRCGKGFAQRTNMLAHEKTHDGIRAFKCPHCPLALTTNANLKRHIKLHDDGKIGTVFGRPTKIPRNVHPVASAEAVAYDNKSGDESDSSYDSDSSSSSSSSNSSSSDSSNTEAVVLPQKKKRPRAHTLPAAAKATSVAASVRGAVEHFLPTGEAGSSSLLEADVFGRQEQEKTPMMGIPVMVPNMPYNAERAALLRKNRRPVLYSRSSEDDGEVTAGVSQLQPAPEEKNHECAICSRMIPEAEKQAHVASHFASGQAMLPERRKKTQVPTAVQRLPDNREAFDIDVAGIRAGGQAEGKKIYKRKIVSENGSSGGENPVKHARSRVLHDSDLSSEDNESVSVLAALPVNIDYVQNEVNTTEYENGDDRGSGGCANNGQEHERTKRFLAFDESYNIAVIDVPADTEAREHKIALPHHAFDIAVGVASVETPANNSCILRKSEQLAAVHITHNNLVAAPVGAASVGCKTIIYDDDSNSEAEETEQGAAQRFVGSARRLSAKGNGFEAALAAIRATLPTPKEARSAVLPDAVIQGQLIQTPQDAHKFIMDGKWRAMLERQIEIPAEIDADDESSDDEEMEKCVVCGDNVLSAIYKQHVADCLARGAVRSTRRGLAKGKTLLSNDKKRRSRRTVPVVAAATAVPALAAPGSALGGPEGLEDFGDFIDAFLAENSPVVETDQVMPLPEKQAVVDEEDDPALWVNYDSD